MTKSISTPDASDRILRLSRAVSDPNRLRLLHALRERELCVCQLTALLDLAPSTVSKHISILRDAGLLRDRRVGKWVHVRRNENPDDPAQDLLAWVDRHAEADPLVEADCCRLQSILSVPVAEIAARTTRN